MPVVEQIANGLALGMIYALIAIGFTVVFGILRMMNFAHGDTYMVGVYVCTSLIALGFSPLVSAILALLAGGFLATAVEITCYRPLRRTNAAMPIVTAVAAGWVIRNAVQYIWGAKPLPFAGLIPDMFVYIGAIKLSLMHGIVLVVSIIAVVLFQIFLRKTKTGLAILATSNDLEVAAVMGISINKVISTTYFIGGMLGVIGGLLYVNIYGLVSPVMGFAGTITAFTAAVLGGMGNMAGALIGGLLLGLVQSLSAAFISTGYRDAVTFGLLILVLLIRPVGLLGSPMLETERV